MLIQACSPSISCVVADSLTRLRLDQLSTAFFIGMIRIVEVTTGFYPRQVYFYCPQE